MTHRPALIFDDVTSGRLLAFATPLAVIRADTAEALLGALVDAEAARRAGRFVAGYISYEAGYALVRFPKSAERFSGKKARQNENPEQNRNSFKTGFALEPRLATRMPRDLRVPLLWFGVFSSPPEALDTALLASWRRGRAYAGPLQPEWDLPAYASRFAAVQALIAAGDFYQANLTFRARFAFAGDPLTLYAQLRPAAAAHYGAYIDDGERQILSLSPELFFEAAADGTIITKPMKGTAARQSDTAADGQARDDLAASPKNRAENLMIVDLLRNDLGRIAALGSVTVKDLFAVETYPTLHQMVSTVSARLQPDCGIAAVIRALFPCGSVTGAPKIRAMETIAELETSPRGVYCGAAGFFAPDGSARFNVAIRTLTIIGGRGELGIGGGIVADSTVAEEYAEALLKARYFTSMRRPLELIETLRWSAVEGFVHGDLHLARMAASAAALGLVFDDARARAVLDEAVYALSLPGQKPAAYRLRLSLDEAGEIACTAVVLPPAKEVWTCVLSPHRVQSTDLLARHKTNWRDLYDIALAPGIDEILFLNEGGELAEGSRTTIFVERNSKLLTPPLSSGALDGVLRRALIAEGRAVEAELTPNDLANGFFVGNSLRGLIRGKIIPPPSLPGRR